MYKRQNIKKEIILDYHIRYCHMGAMKVVKALEENCHIKNINRKVRRYIKNCFIYQLVKTNNERKEGVMIPITSQKKLEKVFLDICGPFPHSGGRHRYKYIIIMMDHFTKFIKLYPVNWATTLKTLGTVSYTHLDVYKRQTQRQHCHVYDMHRLLISKHINYNKILILMSQRYIQILLSCISLHFM